MGILLETAEHAFSWGPVFVGLSALALLLAGLVFVRGVGKGRPHS